MGSPPLSVATFAMPRTPAGAGLRRSGLPADWRHPDWGSCRFSPAVTVKKASVGGAITGDHMLQLSMVDRLLLFGMPIVAAIVVALVFVLIARTRFDPPPSSAARLRMNDDGTLSEAVEQDRGHALAA